MHKHLPVHAVLQLVNGCGGVARSQIAAQLQKHGLLGQGARQELMQVDLAAPAPTVPFFDGPLPRIEDLLDEELDTLGAVGFTGLQENVALFPLLATFAASFEPEGEGK